MPTLKEIADFLGGSLEGPEDIEIQDLRSIENAEPHHIVYAHDEKFAKLARESAVAAVICRPDLDVGDKPAIRVPNARIAAAAVLRWLHPEPRPEPGRHPMAAIAADATVPDSCSIGPFAVIESEAVLGEGVVLGPHAVVGKGARIGDETHVHAHATVYGDVVMGKRCEIHSGAVIGAPGFGYEPTPAGPVAIPQVGSVVLGDDVRIGCNTSVDRAAFDETRIDDNAKIDNLVQIGHNVVIESGVIICGMAGMAGHSSAGANSIVGPQSALATGARVGAGVILGARTGLISNQKIEGPGEVWVDGPARPYREWRRWAAWVRKGKWKDIK